MRSPEALANGAYQVLILRQAQDEVVGFRKARGS
jgi:hypothetical protein